MKKLFSLFFLMALMTGCSGSNRAGDINVPPKVTYSESAGMGTVENYTNAEWLYKNYLQEYGLPEETKPMFMPAISMLANGFALQLKRGDDVKASIEHFHKQAMLFAASGDAASFFKAMSECYPRQYE